MLAIQSVADEVVRVQLIQHSICVILLTCCEYNDLEELAHCFDET